MIEKLATVKSVKKEYSYNVDFENNTVEICKQENDEVKGILILPVPDFVNIGALFFKLRKLENAFTDYEFEKAELEKEKK